MAINWLVRGLLSIIAVSAALMLSGCGDRHNPDHYAGTAFLGTPACNGGDVCKGGSDE